MKTLISFSSLIVALLWSAVLSGNAQVNVTQKNNNLSRDGLYVDSVFTPANAANLTRDLNFGGTIVGNVHAQPLYIESGPNGPMVIAVTASNNVYALDATDGSIIWQRNVGTPVTSGLPCGNISPFGIIGTPVVDLASRALFFNAMIDGPTKRHFVFSLNLDTGDINPGWPVDLNATVGTNMFVITGNTFNTGGNWMGGEAIIRLQAGPVWSGQPTDYWAPINWFSLDQSDTDLGGCSAILIDVPGANPSQLVLALGKDGNAYLLNRNNLGGIVAPVAQRSVDGVTRGQSSATYHTNQGTYFVFRTGSGAVSAYKVTAADPPAMVPAWSVNQSGQGSPWVTTTDGTNNAIVWVVGAEGDNRLHGYNGDTGAVVYAGGGNNELMTGTRKWNSGIVARGSIYVANDNKVYKFKLPTGTPTRATVEWVLGNAGTRQTAIWYLNNNVFISGTYGPTLPAGWGLRSVADFNRDTHPDYALFNPVTDRTAIWYLSGPTFIGSAYGPTLPSGWELVATADFNGDSKPDYVLYNARTRQTAIWYLNNNVFVSAAWGQLSLRAGAWW